jgi:hypothetical protein
MPVPSCSRRSSTGMAASASRVHRHACAQLICVHFPLVTLPPLTTSPSARHRAAIRLSLEGHPASCAAPAGCPPPCRPAVPRCPPAVPAAAPPAVPAALSGACVPALPGLAAQCCPPLSPRRQRRVVTTRAERQPGCSGHVNTTIDQHNELVTSRGFQARRSVVERCHGPERPDTATGYPRATSRGRRAESGEFSTTERRCGATAGQPVRQRRCTLGNPD